MSRTERKHPKPPHEADLLVASAQRLGLGADTDVSNRLCHRTLSDRWGCFSDAWFKKLDQGSSFGRSISRPQIISMQPRVD